MRKQKATSALLDQILLNASLQGSDADEQSKAARYYDGNQDTEEIREYRAEHEMPDMVVNLIQENINSVLGAEEQRRVDWMLNADDDNSQEVAEALNVRLNETMRMVDANHHCSEAYKSQIVTGIGWLYFGKSTNPLAYKYETHLVPRKQIIYDRRSTRQDMRDCKWIARKKFLDEDAAIALFPEHEKLIEQTFSRWDEWDIVPGGLASELTGGEYFDSKYRSDIYMEDGGIKQIAIYDVFYRSYEKRMLIFLPNDAVEEYDPESPRHLASVLSRESYLREEYVPVMRRAWFIGPHMVEDEDSDEPHNEFPYIKFTGYIEDETNAHYGLVRAMIGPQDAYNNANVRVHHILNSKQIIAENGAFDGVDGMDDDDVISEANRADGYFKVNKGYRFEINTAWGELNKLMEIKNSAREEIRAASGISYSFAGQDVEQKSGVAIASLAEMSAATLAEINSNYQFARQQFGRIVLAHLRQDIGNSEHEVPITNELGHTKKRITLNKRDPEKGLTNALPQARLSVVLADAQTSDGYRQQNQQQMMQIYQVSPPEVQAELFPLIIEQSNMPKRQEFLAEYNRKRGIGGTEDEQAARAAAQAKEQQEQADLEKATLQAEVDYKNAQTENVAMETRKMEWEMANGDTDVINTQQQAANDDAAEVQAMIAEARRSIAERALTQRQ